ncbi:MAG: cation transporter [Legionellaceae bacterium]|nr:cation transporter [Legionellaceae bacterium]
MGQQHAPHQPPAHFNRAFLIATVANSVFVLVQIFYALYANSTSLLADAIHNLGDVVGLILAWTANSLMQRKPTDTSSFGLKKSSIMAALANGTLLIFSCGIIATEALYKFLHPEPIHALLVIIVATLGIIVNGATAALFLRGQKDLNIHAAFLHLFYDALISAGVVLAAALMYVTDWLWLDPLVAFMIAFIILKGTWALFRDSLRLMMDAVPRDISLQRVRERLLAVPGVTQVHDLHIWALSTRENALSAHLLMPTDTKLSDPQRQMLVDELKKNHRIQHVTLQIEHEPGYCEAYCTP